MSGPNATNLSRLTRVDLRSIWSSEGSEFTPWLARSENLELLADALDIDLQFEAQEKNVGPFRADILCKDATGGHWVLIENQLERTDHTHLGQLITYAAGLKAATIIWISNRFTEEHRAALDWLNEITGEQFNFFGVEVELWRIDDSPIAPKFNVVCKPNDWSKTVTESAAQIERGELTETKQTQLDFWTEFRSYLLANSKVIRPQKAHPQTWMDFALGRSGIYLTGVANLGSAGAEDKAELRAELTINHEQAKAIYAKFSTDKLQIEAEFVQPLTWHNSAEKRGCRVFTRRPADIRNRADWPAQHEWLKQSLENLHRVFSSRAKGLVLEELVSPEGMST